MELLYRIENMLTVKKILEADEDFDVDSGSHSEKCIKFVQEYTKSGKILEVGCGKGKLFESVAVTDAIEPVSKRLEVDITKERAKKYGVCLKYGFAECIPYDDNLFDTIIMLQVYEHVRSDLETLLEVSRVLKIGGHFIIASPQASVEPHFIPTHWRVICPSFFIEMMYRMGFILLKRQELKAVGGEGMIFAFKKYRDFDVSVFKNYDDIINE